MHVEQDQLREIVDRLVTALQPRAIYLFGSHACGTPTQDSDVDVLVVLGDGDYSLWDVAKRGYNAVDRLGPVVELHFTWPEQFHERAAAVGSLEHKVLSEGRLLYAA